MSSERLPGVEAKIAEYALRILNGENPDSVLQGTTFGPAVEARVLEYRAAREAQKEKEEVVPVSPEQSESGEAAIARRKAQDAEKIQDLHKQITELSPGYSPVPHKEYEWNDPSHRQAVDMYNTIVDIGNGIVEGLKEGFEPKVQQYVAEIRAGKSKEYVLDGAPKSLRDAVEAVLAKENQETAPGMQKLHGMVEIAPAIAEIAQTHYLFTHQTSEDVAQKIYESNFQVSPGTGISGTMTFGGAQGVRNQIERQLQGDAHRGYKGMFIVAVPKALLDASLVRSKADAFEDVLLESPEYGKNGNANIIIPQEYNFGYLQGEDLYIRNQQA